MRRFALFFCVLGVSPAVFQGCGDPASNDGNEVLFRNAKSIRLRQDSWFKAENRRSSELYSNQKCFLQGGTRYTLSSSPESAAGDHFRVRISGLSDCSFSVGYIYGAHFDFVGHGRGRDRGRGSTNSTELPNCARELDHMPGVTVSEALSACSRSSWPQALPACARSLDHMPGVTADEAIHFCSQSRSPNQLPQCTRELDHMPGITAKEAIQTCLNGGRHASALSQCVRELDAMPGVTVSEAINVCGRSNYPDDLPQCVRETDALPGITVREAIARCL